MTHYHAFMATPAKSPSALGAHSRVVTLLHFSWVTEPIQEEFTTRRVRLETRRSRSCGRMLRDMQFRSTGIEIPQPFPGAIAGERGTWISLSSRRIPSRSRGVFFATRTRVENKRHIGLRFSVSPCLQPYPAGGQFSHRATGWRSHEVYQPGTIHDSLKTPRLACTLHLSPLPDAPAPWANKRIREL